MSSKTWFCAQRAPNLVASRLPFHFAGGAGAFQRMSPTGGAAYGSPRNAFTLPLLRVFPSALPCSVFTVSASAYAVTEIPNPRLTAARAHTSFIPTCIRKILRGIRYQDGPAAGRVSGLLMGLRPNRRAFCICFVTGHDFSRAEER